nr:hypothetical protein [Tanacetum cinerariifolium]
MGHHDEERLLLEGILVEDASKTLSVTFGITCMDEKTSVKVAAIDNDVCNLSVPSCYLFDDYMEELTFNLENPELTEAVDLSSALNEILQADNTIALASSFVRSTVIDKLHRIMSFSCPITCLVEVLLLFSMIMAIKV